MRVEDQGLISNAIFSEITKRIEKVVEEEIADACKRVATRMHAEVANIALSVAGTYDVRREEQNIVIKVRGLA